MGSELYRLASVKEAKLPDLIKADWVTVVLDRQPPNIFLSHSGAQKNFVEQLCEDLERATQSPFFDKRPHSLPKGEEFAPLIFTAATECKVAVVVVSDEYFTRSKWPMLELAAIVRAPECKIIPLFYGLSCREFKNKRRRERWFQVWAGWSKLDNRISVGVWEAALRRLDGLNGMEYVKANGEVSYRKEVVTSACDLMRRIPQDEIMVVERATSDHACQFDLQHQSCTSAVTRFNIFKSACLRMTLPVVYQQIVAFLTILLLFTGYCHYFHDFNGSPPGADKSSAGELSDKNISRVSFNVSIRARKFYAWPPEEILDCCGQDTYITPYPPWLMSLNVSSNSNLDLLNRKRYTATSALQTEIYPAESKYGQQLAVSCPDDLTRLITSTYQICLSA